MADSLKSVPSHDLAAKLRNAYWLGGLGSMFDLVMEAAERLEKSDPDYDEFETRADELVDAD